MLHFGKQQEILNLLSMANPESRPETAANCSLKAARNLKLMTLLM
jgi:hypothetical protein